MQVWRAQRIVAEEELLLQAARQFSGSSCAGGQDFTRIFWVSSVFRRFSATVWIVCSVNVPETFAYEYQLRPAACTGLSRHAQHWPKGSAAHLWNFNGIIPIFMKRASLTGWHFANFGKASVAGRSLFAQEPYPLVSRWPTDASWCNTVACASSVMLTKRRRSLARRRDMTRFHDQTFAKDTNHLSNWSRIPNDCERDLKDVKRFSTALGGPRKSLSSLFGSPDMPQILQRSFSTCAKIRIQTV